MLTDPKSFLPTFLHELFLRSCSTSPGLGGLRALCSSFCALGRWLKLSVHSEITVFICFQYLITVWVEESGAEWDPDGRAAVPHTLPWHRHGLAPSIPLSLSLTHTSAFQLSLLLSLLFSTLPFWIFLFNLNSVSCIFLYSPSIPLHFAPHLYVAHSLVLIFISFLLLLLLHLLLLLGPTPKWGHEPEPTL